MCVCVCVCVCVNIYMIDNQTIAVHAFARGILMSLSVNETRLPRYVCVSSKYELISDVLL